MQAYVFGIDDMEALAQDFRLLVQLTKNADLCNMLSAMS